VLAPLDIRGLSEGSEDGITLLLDITTITAPLKHNQSRKLAGGNIGRKGGEKVN